MQSCMERDPSSIILILQREDMDLLECKFYNGNRWLYYKCKIQDAKSRQKSPSAHHRTTLSGYIFTTEACIDNLKKKTFNQRYLVHMLSQYGELRPTNGWDRLASLGHPRKFQRVLRFGFVTVPEINRSLHDVRPSPWLVYLYFGGSYPLTAFYQVQNSLCVQVLRSPGSGYNHVSSVCLSKCRFTFSFESILSETPNSACTTDVYITN